MMSRARGWAAVVLAPTLAASPVMASGLSAPVVGNSSSSVVARDPAAVYWNPAMLTRVVEARASEWMIGFSALYLDVRYDRDRLGDYQHSDGLRFKAPVPSDDIDPSLTGPAGSASASAFIPLGPIPVAPAPQLFYARRITDEFSAGLGMFVPFGAVLEFDDDGPQKWALQSVELLTVEASAAASYKVDDALSIGVGGGLVGGQLRLRKVVDLASTPLMRDAFANPPIGQPNSFGPDAPSEVRELDILSRPVDIGPGFGWSWVARIGIAYKPLDEVQLGLSYAHRVPLVFEGGFTLDMDDPFFTEDLVAQGLKYPATVKGQAAVTFPVPPNLNTGVDWQIDERWSVGANASLFFNSVVDVLGAELTSNQLVQPELGLGPDAAVDLPRNWSDTWHLDVRGMYTADDWFAGGVLGYHTAASPDSTLDVASPDGPRVVVGATGGYELGTQDWLFGGDLALLVDVHAQYVLPRENTGSDYDLANGTYSLFLAALSAGARVRFE